VREVGVEGAHLRFTQFRYRNRELVQGVGSVESLARWKVHPRYYSPNGYWRAGASSVFASPFDSSYIGLYVVACA
jgi:hypothetical protein